MSIRKRFAMQEEQRREYARQRIEALRLGMTVQPNGLIHIHGRGLDLKVRDLAALQESDFRTSW